MNIEYLKNIIKKCDNKKVYIIYDGCCLDCDICYIDESGNLILGGYKETSDKI